MDPTINEAYRTDCIFNSLDRLTTAKMDWLFATWAKFRWIQLFLTYSTFARIKLGIEYI